LLLLLLLLHVVLQGTVFFSRRVQLQTYSADGGA
jgi:hypothetical protein